MRPTVLRRVAWPGTTDSNRQPVRLLSPSAQSSQLARITSDILSAPSLEVVDGALRDAVEFAREVLHLERAAIYLLDPDGRAMTGTWGTGADGRTTDEHDLMFEVGDETRWVFERAAEGYAWSIYENSPYMAHEGGRTRVLGRGWLACTAIPGRVRPAGILFNDSALTRAPVDEGRQARAAVLCALLGHALDHCRVRLLGQRGLADRAPPALVQQATRVLARDPSMSFRALAQQLRVSQGHLTRSFKRHTGTSIVDYRNDLRLAHFLGKAKDKPDALVEAARDAGFGSYAQFHRVFRARFGQGPREYFFERRAEHGGARLPGGS
jgi:AraC-like DNA-binding protein